MSLAKLHLAAETFAANGLWFAARAFFAADSVNFELAFALRMLAIASVIANRIMQSYEAAMKWASGGVCGAGAHSASSAPTHLGSLKGGYFSPGCNEGG